MGVCIPIPISFYYSKRKSRFPKSGTGFSV